MFIYCICTQYLVGAPFALITASIRRGMEVISLWHCWGGVEAQVSLTVAFSSSAFFGLLFLISLLTIRHRFSGFRSGEFAGQSSTPKPAVCVHLIYLIRISQFELNYWNKWTFPRHSNLLRCTCIYISVAQTYWIEALSSDDYIISNSNNNNNIKIISTVITCIITFKLFELLKTPMWMWCVLAGTLSQFKRYSTVKSR